VICLVEEQRKITHKGGTMRLVSYNARPDEYRVGFPAAVAGLEDRGAGQRRVAAADRGRRRVHRAGASPL